MAFDTGQGRGGLASPAASSSPVADPDATDRRRAANQRIVGLTIVAASLATLAACAASGPLVLTTLSSFLLTVAAAAAGVAYLAGHRAFAPHFTFWDQAAALLALGLAVSLAVDGAAVQAFLEAKASASPLGG